MDSLTKVQLTDQQLQRIASVHLAEHGPLASWTELTEGWFNTAYALTLADGQRVVMKIAPTSAANIMRYERDAMRTEVEAMRFVHAAGVMPVPRILCYDTSHRLLAADFFMMAYLPGRPLNLLGDVLSNEAKQHIDLETGRLLRRLNAIHGFAFGPYLHAEYANWRDAFTAMVEDVLADAQDKQVVLPISPRDIRRVLERYSPVMDAVQTPCLVHWDLWAGNIFVDPQTNRITGIIDFERALWGDPLIEAAYGSVTPDAPVIRGYGRPLLHTSEQRCRRSLYNLYLDLIMIVECSFRGYSTAHEQGARTMFTDEWARLATLVCQIEKGGQ